MVHFKPVRYEEMEDELADADIVWQKYDEAGLIASDAAAGGDSADA